MDANAVTQHVEAWIAHAENANIWRLRQTLFRGGWFDVESCALREPDGPPDGRGLRGGTWNNNGFRLVSTPSCAKTVSATAKAGVP